MIIRSMDSEDARQVAELEKATFSLPWSEKGFLDALQMENNILIVAEEDSKILGYICMYVSFDEGEITNVVVSPEYRGQGIGSRMMEYIFELARNKSIQRIVLEVRVSNGLAIGLYNKCGFQEVGIRKNFYEKPVEDAAIMIATLEEI